PSCAVNRTRRSVEHREGAVAGCLDQLPAEPLDLPTDQLVVRLQQRGPGTVAELRCPLGRSNQIREQYRGQHTCAARLGTHAGEERLDLVKKHLHIAGVPNMIGARQLHQLRMWDSLGQHLAVTAAYVRVPGRVQDERWSADAR